MKKVLFLLIVVITAITAMVYKKSMTVTKDKATSEIIQPATDIRVIQIETEAITEKTEQVTESLSLLKSADDIMLRDTDGQGINFCFEYDNETFSAFWKTDKWQIIDSYKIENEDDIKIICEALRNVHQVQNAERNGFRTAEDMAYEWVQHNLAYEMLPDDSGYKDNAKDVDLNPDDQGKSLYDLFVDRIK